MARGLGGGVEGGGTKAATWLGLGLGFGLGLGLGFGSGLGLGLGRGLGLGLGLARPDEDGPKGRVEPGNVARPAAEKRESGRTC